MSLSTPPPPTAAEKQTSAPETAKELVMLAAPTGIPRGQHDQACERIKRPHLQGFEVHPRRDERSGVRQETPSCHFRW
jgi:hypothetical protein